MIDSVRVKSCGIVLVAACSLWVATPAAAEISFLCGTEVNSLNEINYDGNTLRNIRVAPSWISTPNVLRCDTEGSQEIFIRQVRPSFQPFGSTAQAQAEFRLTANDNASIITSRGTSLADIQSTSTDPADVFTGRSEITVQNIIKIASDTPLYYQFLPIAGEVLEFPDFSFISPAGDSLANGALEGTIYNADGSGNVELRIASSASVARGIDDPLSVVQSGPAWNFRLFVTPVPEPSTHLMLLSGLLGIGLWGRKRFIKSI